MHKLHNIAFHLVCGLLAASSAFAQVEPEQIAATTDDFQNSYFEALKQKSIENFDKAVTALEKCAEIQKENPAVYNELGKSYLKLKKYDIAYSSFQKAHDLDPKNRWYLDGMYEVCYAKQDWQQAIVLVQQLVAFEASYQEDLVSLYMNTLQYDKALALINQLNETVGESDKRRLYKAQILSNAKYQGGEKDDLLSKIKKNPKEESNYVELITIYSNSNQEEKALEVAKMLEKEIPTSDWAQVSLFKLHLTNNDGTKAGAALKQALKSSRVDAKIKHRMINEFLIFITKNQQFEPVFEEAIALLPEDKNIVVATEVGKYFFNKKDYSKAAKYLQKGISIKPDDFEAARLLFQSLSQNQQYDALLKQAQDYADLFPNQPEPFYYKGLALFKSGKVKEAVSELESGVDFVLDNPTFEAAFYKLLADVYQSLGDLKNKDKYLKKAEKLK